MTNWTRLRDVPAERLAPVFIRVGDGLNDVVPLLRTPTSVYMWEAWWVHPYVQGEMVTTARPDVFWDAVAVDGVWSTPPAIPSRSVDLRTVSDLAKTALDLPDESKTVIRIPDNVRQTVMMYADNGPRTTARLIQYGVLSMLATNGDELNNYIDPDALIWNEVRDMVTVRRNLRPVPQDMSVWTGRNDDLAERIRGIHEFLLSRARSADRVVTTSRLGDITAMVSTECGQSTHEWIYTVLYHMLSWNGYDIQRHVSEDGDVGNDFHTIHRPGPGAEFNDPFSLFIV